FIESVFAAECVISQLTKQLFVVNGWTSASRNVNASINNWYHLDRLTVGSDRIIVCMCPAGRSRASCFHSQFMLEYGQERFPPGDDVPDLDDGIIVFSRYETEDGVYRNLLSVPTRSNPTIKNRAVVEYIGANDGSGIWKCNRDPNLVNCPHVTDARHSFQKHIQLDLGASDPDPPIKRASSNANESVSYHALPPPIWARLPSDPPPPPIHPPSSAPAMIPLNPDSASCFCKPDRVRYNPFLPVEARPCIIYGLGGAWESTIEVQRCHACKRYVGPDCREIGIFNWNNHILATHQLLEDYLNAFTASETPISAWVNVVSRRYKSAGTRPFLTHTPFTSVWFSYARLLQLHGDMKCSLCGPCPEVLIFDGVSLSFNQKNVLSSLKPPTTIHQIESVIREKTVRVRNTQFITDSALRKNIRKILSGASLHLADLSSLDQQISVEFSFLDLLVEDSVESGSSQDEEVQKRNNARREVAKERKRQALLKRFQLIPGVVAGLKKIDQELGTLFELWFGSAAVVQKTVVPSVYRALFIQISAEESALQMINQPSLKRLKEFIIQPTTENQSYLLHIPALYKVLAYEGSHSISGEISATIVAVCRWLYLRAETVRRLLLVHETETPNPTIDVEGADWRMTGCFYEKPQIRYRPQYPHLNEGKKVDPGIEKAGGCRKYYTKYSPRKLTGGIMVPWCTHSVAYGFHCIPIAEGRNDVFSALYTRWEKAPKIILYDFACALQPYCMLREPAFFQDTLFAIDQFHAPDHTKCCPSSFLSTYAQTDSRLALVNSSAGECGNGGLARIRKSVSYMNQEHAIMFTRVFLSIWNRLRISGL
ncbi:hypothetical protein GALMADRAFT_45477, partial [Galerina marginata CBS 339.88]